MAVLGTLHAIETCWNLKPIIELPAHPITPPCSAATRLGLAQPRQLFKIAEAVDQFGWATLLAEAVSAADAGLKFPVGPSRR